MGAYNEVSDVAAYLKYLRCVVPNSAENNNTYFSQCPSSFDSWKLQRFGRVIYKKHISNMAANAATMQKKTVKTWKLNVNKPSESVFIGLVRINESAVTNAGPFL